MASDSKASTWSIRLATDTDADAIACLSRDLIEHGLGWRWTTPRIRASLHAVNTNLAVAIGREGEGDGEGCIAGFGLMVYRDDEAHLSLLAVDPRWQRRGIARGLVRWLERCAVTAGIGVVRLEAREHNHGALAFYAGLGYQPVRRVPGYYLGREDAICLARDLWLDRWD
jgi:ribosomal-protein-alanine N-acetyltransferase